MAVPSTYEAAPADGDSDFVRDSYLAYAVPLATDSRLEQDLELCASKGQSLQALIEGIEDRESLFFDETVDVYLILRTPYQSEPRLRSYLERLAIVLEAQILNSHASGRETASPVVETIFNGVVENIHEPLAIVSDPDVSPGRKAIKAKESAADDDEENSESDDSDDTQVQKTSEPNKPKEEEDEPTRQTYCLWKLPVFLARPRARLHSPSVSFSAVASLKAASAVAAAKAAHAVGNGLLAPYGDANGLLGGLTPSGRMAGYLQSREPNGLNLLESFGGDPALAGAWPRLSAQRVSRVAPAAASMNPRFQPRPLRGIKNISFNIFPAVHTRIRFARPNASPSSPAVVAMLEIDFTPFFECEAVLSSINLSLPSGEVTDLNTADGLALPLYCVARDHFTFLYRLAPLEFDVSRPPSQHNHQGRLPGAHGGSFSGAGNGYNANGSPSAAARDLDIYIEVKVLVKPGVCTPTLRMSWATSLDFTLPVNPGFGTALMPPPSLQRAHRPSQLSIDGMSSFTAPSVSRPDALPSLEAAATHNTATTIPDFGITMTFTAPSHKVYAGEEFSWTVFVVNRASQMPLTPTLPTSATLGGGVVPPQPPAPRKLALIALPKRRRNDVRVIRPPSTAGGRSHARLGATGALDDAGSGPAEAVADAVLDENIVHAMQRSSLVDSTDVVCLSSADTRVGPLAPNACHVVELRFVALRAGAVGIEAIRVVDLGSQEHVDVRELPAMIIAEGQRGDDEK